MYSRTAKQLTEIGRETAAFFVPRTQDKSIDEKKLGKIITAAIIPTHGPTAITCDLIKSIIKWHPDVLIVVVDDATPLTKENLPTINEINALATQHHQVIAIRTPFSSLKAGALNYGISYLSNLYHMPHVIFTFDDDVAINKQTIPTMIKELYTEKNIGAVCSQVRARNKDTNLLTRLQGLEYHGFNITKIADNGFLKGPLVMQGMLTAFRANALKQVKGFTQGHLIEDYDITARLKQKGWKVKIAKDAVAWTTMPETLEALWKQRVRWTSGGLYVLSQYWRNVTSIYQDILGHAIFVSLLLLVLFSFFFKKTQPIDGTTASILLILAGVNFVLAFIFNIATLKMYASRDKKDIALKLSIFPELIYSNILSFILLGSYLFFTFNLFANALSSRFSPVRKPYSWGLTAFKKAGFSSTWGTR